MILLTASIVVFAAVICGTVGLKQVSHRCEGDACEQDIGTHVGDSGAILHREVERHAAGALGPICQSRLVESGIIRWTGWVTIKLCLPRASVHNVHLNIIFFSNGIYRKVTKIVECLKHSHSKLFRTKAYCCNSQSLIWRGAHRLRASCLRSEFENGY